MKNILLSCAFFTAVNVSAVDSQPNDDLTIYPVMNHFGTVQLGSDSTASVITVTNNTGASVTITSAPNLSGPDADQFSIASTTCGASLANGSSCEVNVTFSPIKFGSKMAYLNIGTNVAGTPNLTAFLSNDEDIASEAQRRFPPVLTEVKVLQGATEVDLLTTALTSGQTYTIEWKLLGYDDVYASYPAFFDCGATAPSVSSTCGNDFVNRVTTIASADITDDTGVEQNFWRYQTEKARYYSFSQTFTVAASDLTGGAGEYYMALRFYYKNSIDISANSSAISLIAPANIAGIGKEVADKSGHIGNDGRRLFIRVSK